MLDVAPKESEWLSWFYALLVSAIIFCTVPLARAIQSGVANQFGREFFLYIVSVVGAIGGLAAIKVIRKRRVSRQAYFWLAGVGVVYSIYLYVLRANPEETVHFVEYGALSLLVYRALLHRIRDNSIYITAALIVGIVGLVDEWLQWLAPNRVWDLRDVRINVVAGALIQVSIAAGLRPALVSGWPSGTSLRRLFHVAAAALFLLGLCYVNTPERIATYATRIPALSFLMSRKSMMIEYGYLYRDPAIGVFRSRFTREELAINDRNRGAEVARVLDVYITEEMYDRFQEVYSVPNDPYIHEVGIHLFGRNRNLRNAKKKEPRPSRHYDIAYRENQILEKYFPTSLTESRHRWSRQLRKQVGEMADTSSVYESRVSAGLITRFTERQVLLGYGAAIVAMLLLAAVFGGRRKIGANRRTSDNRDG